MNFSFKNTCLSRRNRRFGGLGFVHPGGDVALRGEDIIGIFDIDNTTVSRSTREFLNAAERRGIVENLAPDIPVSFILTVGEGERVYFSQYSPRSLAKRAAENPLGV